ncbi:hypothetical protein F5Y15DRAFT_423241 [Xylariaceae sp. FL0016]|nr:hypothetical protein F5Y15DRAFT_423241 [Xylariaceae sp. FL0016]
MTRSKSVPPAPKRTSAEAFGYPDENTRCTKKACMTRAPSPCLLPSFSPFPSPSPSLSNDTPQCESSPSPATDDITDSTRLWKNSLELILRERQLVNTKNGEMPVLNIKTPGKEQQPKPATATLGHHSHEALPSSPLQSPSCSQRTTSPSAVTEDRTIILIDVSDGEDDEQVRTPHKVGGATCHAGESEDCEMEDDDEALHLIASNEVHSHQQDDNPDDDRFTVDDNQRYVKNDTAQYAGYHEYEEHEDKKEDKFYRDGACNSMSKAPCTSRLAYLTGEYAQYYDGPHARSPEPEEDLPGFYGFTSRASEHYVVMQLRYQRCDESVGQYPSPQAGLRFDYEGFMYNNNLPSRKNARKTIKNLLEDTSWSGPSKWDMEEWYNFEWIKNDRAYIVKGLPLMEDVEMVVHKNNSKPPGDCYWRTLSLNLTGTPQNWDLVKAEHLAYLYQVLRNEHHPRHKLYTELNSKFFQTRSVCGPSFRANLWQILHTPHAWTPGVIQQVTADLYNVCLITFTYDAEKGTCSETSVRGAYNSRHLFMLYVGGNHFQPMIPNDYLASEFQYPRVTVPATSTYMNAPRATANKTTLQHPWRNDYTKEVPQPVSRAHGCDVDGLRFYMGS